MTLVVGQRWSVKGYGYDIVVEIIGANETGITAKVLQNFNPEDADPCNVIGYEYSFDLDGEIEMDALCGPYSYLDGQDKP